MNQLGRGNPLQRRLTGVGLNMIVMALSFMLYYLGFFGKVDGPLSMTNIGKALSGVGITSDGLQIILFVLFVISLTWNWVLNLVARRTGRNFSCTYGNKEKGPCGLLAQRSTDSKGRWIYTCPSGHRKPEAHFQPIKKGVFANSAMMVSLACCVMYYIR